LVEISYQITKLDETYLKKFEWKREFPYRVAFDVRLLSQKCLKCRSWTDAKIYESQMLTIVKMFCYVIAEKLECLKANKKPKAKKRFDKNEKPGVPAANEEKAHKKE
jgi:hypothetical protein